jgi:hypothetical protein
MRGGPLCKILDIYVSDCINIQLRVLGPERAVFHYNIGFKKNQ